MEAHEGGEGRVGLQGHVRHARRRKVRHGQVHRDDRAHARHGEHARAGPAGVGRPLLAGEGRHQPKGDILPPRRGRHRRLSEGSLQGRRARQRLRQPPGPPGVRLAQSPVGGSAHPRHPVELEPLPRTLSRGLQHTPQLHRGQPRSRHRIDGRRRHHSRGRRRPPKGPPEVGRARSEGAGDQGLAHGHPAVRAWTSRPDGGAGGDGGEERGRRTLGLRELQERRGVSGLCYVRV
mmetsp:Transcript_384/g.1007  ORF Transcript_384/g.1007 Transcript_384/m.1007 type:complete len:234 (-) Transcript_384:179-880(-)